MRDPGGAQEVVKDDASAMMPEDESGDRAPSGAASDSGRDRPRPAPQAAPQAEWRAALADALKQVVGAKRYEAWFENRVSFDLADDAALLVRIGSSLERDCLRKSFKGELAQACVLAGLGKRRIEFAVDALAPDPAPADRARRRPAPSPAAPHRVKPADAAKRPLLLERFIVGDSNREAAGVAEMLAGGAPAPSPVVLWGPSGCGKSHLLRAIAEARRAGGRRKRVVCLTAEEFTSGFVEAVHGRSLAAFRGRHRDLDLLLIDDIQFLIGKPKTLEELQYTLDALANHGAAVVLTSDRSPAELRKMSGEMLARLGAGVAVEIAAPHPAVKSRLVHRFAHETGVRLEPHAVRAIASGLIGGAWEVQGVVNKLGMTSRLLDLDVCDKAVGKAIDDMNRLSTPSVGIKEIQAAVCKVFGVESAVIKSDKRTKSATEPRMVAMWLARKYTPFAWSEIGDQFGRRAHSTVISACRRVEELLDSQASVRVSGGPCRLHEAVRLVEAALRTA